MMSRKRLIQWTAILVAVIALLVVAGVSDAGIETEAERTQRLTYSYACPECKGQSVAESNAAVSVTIRNFIAEAVADGKTDTEIRDELLRGYGERVLLNPPSDGFASLLWILPVVLVVAGAAAVAAIVTRDTSARRTMTAADEAVVAEALKEQR